MKFRNHISIRIIAITLACLIVFQDVSFALSPTSRLKPITDPSTERPLVKLDHESRKLAVDHELKKEWDEATERHIAANPLDISLAERFRNNAGFYYLAVVIGQYLSAGISRYSALSDIKKIFTELNIKADLAGDPLLFGAEIDELYWNVQNMECYLPFYKDGVFVYRYRFTVRALTDRMPDFEIPVPGGEKVYTYLEPVDGEKVALLRQFAYLRHDIRKPLDKLDFGYEKVGPMTGGLRSIYEIRKRIEGNLWSYPKDINESSMDRATFDARLKELRSIILEAYDLLEPESIRTILSEAYELLPSELKVPDSRESYVDRMVDDLMYVRNSLCDFFPDMRIPPKKVSLNAILRAAFFPATREVTSEECRTEFNAGEVDTVLDEIALFRVLVNLVSNACDANSEARGIMFEQTKKVDDESVKIIVRTERSGNILRIIVEDKGAGIPKKIVPEIFREGFTTKTGTMKGPGIEHGLGLAIVKRLVEERLGGTIAVESRHISEHPDDHGTVFTITLPISEIEGQGAGGKGQGDQGARASGDQDTRVLGADDSTEYVVRGTESPAADSAEPAAEGARSSVAMQDAAPHKTHSTWADRFFENHLADNRFTSLSIMKMAVGVLATGCAFWADTNGAYAIALCTTVWCGLLIARNIGIDTLAIDGWFPARWQWASFRRLKLANDLFVSGLSAAPIVLVKRLASEVIAPAVGLTPLSNILLDIAFVSLVGGVPNYLQRILRGYPQSVAWRDFFRSLVMSAGAYGLFALVYSAGWTASIVPSASLFAVVRKVIGEWWAACVEYPEVRRRYAADTPYMKNALLTNLARWFVHRSIGPTPLNAEADIGVSGEQREEGAAGQRPEALNPESPELGGKQQTEGQSCVGATKDRFSFIDNHGEILALLDPGMRIFFEQPDGIFQRVWHIIMTWMYKFSAIVSFVHRREKILILNFDAHRDTYGGIRDSGDYKTSWATVAEALGLAKIVYMPSQARNFKHRISDGAHQEWEEPGYLDAITPLLKSWRGPVWISLDFDYLSLRNNAGDTIYHRDGAFLAQALERIAALVGRYDLDVKRVVGSRSRGYLAKDADGEYISRIEKLVIEKFASMLDRTRVQEDEVHRVVRSRIKSLMNFDFPVPFDLDFSDTKIRTRGCTLVIGMRGRDVNDPVFQDQIRTRARVLWLRNYPKARKRLEDAYAGRLEKIASIFQSVSASERQSGASVKGGKFGPFKATATYDLLNIIQALGLRRDSHFLDLGCGYGQKMVEASLICDHIDGVEGDEYRAGKARELLQAAQEQGLAGDAHLNLMSADFKSSDISFGKYDVIFVFLTEEMVNDPALVSKLEREMKPGAKIVFIHAYPKRIALTEVVTGLPAVSVPYSVYEMPGGATAPVVGEKNSDSGAPHAGEDRESALHAGDTPHIKNPPLTNLQMPPEIAAWARGGPRPADLIDKLEASAIIPEPRPTDKASAASFAPLPQYEVNNAEPKCVVVFGAGHIGPRHLAAMLKAIACLSGNVNLRLLGLVDTEPDEGIFNSKADAAAALYREMNGQQAKPEFFRDVDAALNRAKKEMGIDPRNIIALVCVPNEHHLSVSADLAARGIKMICIEKPLANNMENIDGIIALEKRENLRMACVTQFPFTQAFQRVLSFIKERSDNGVKPTIWETFYSKDRGSNAQAGKNIKDPHILLYEYIHQLAMAWQISPVENITNGYAEDMVFADGRPTIKFHGRGVAASVHKDIISINCTNFTRPGLSPKQKIFNIHFDDGSVLAVNLAPDIGYVSHFIYYDANGNILQDFNVDETVLDMLVLGDAAWLYSLLSGNESVPFSHFKGMTDATSLQFHRTLMQTIYKGIRITKTVRVIDTFRNLAHHTQYVVRNTLHATAALLRRIRARFQRMGPPPMGAVFSLERDLRWFLQLFTADKDGAGTVAPVKRDRHPKGYYTREQILYLLRENPDHIPNPERSSSWVHSNYRGIFSPAKKVFGSWHNALREAGLTPCIQGKGPWRDNGNLSWKAVADIIPDLCNRSKDGLGPGPWRDLTDQETRALAGEVQNGSSAARIALILLYERLVWSVVRRYAVGMERFGVTEDDLFSIGNDALARAVELYNPNEVMSFAGYAKRWITSKIGRYCHTVRNKKSHEAFSRDDYGDDADPFTRSGESAGATDHPDFGLSLYEAAIKKLVGKFSAAGAIITERDRALLELRLRGNMLREIGRIVGVSHEQVRHELMDLLRRMYYAVHTTETDAPEDDAIARGRALWDRERRAYPHAYSKASPLIKVLRWTAGGDAHIRVHPDYNRHEAFGDVVDLSGQLVRTYFLTFGRVVPVDDMQTDIPIHRNDAFWISIEKDLTPDEIYSLLCLPDPLARLNAFRRIRDRYIAHTDGGGEPTFKRSALSLCLAICRSRAPYEMDNLILKFENLLLRRFYNGALLSTVCDAEIRQIFALDEYVLDRDGMVDYAHIDSVCETIITSFNIDILDNDERVAALDLLLRVLERNALHSQIKSIVRKIAVNSASKEGRLQAMRQAGRKIMCMRKTGIFEEVVRKAVADLGVSDDDDFEGKEFQVRGLAFVGGTAVSLALGAPLAGALLAGIAAEVAAPRISQWLWNKKRDSDPFSTPGLPAMASSFTSNAGAGRGGLSRKIESWKALYHFGAGEADGDATMKNLLGKKGANLAEMVGLGLSVPPGFTIPNTLVQKCSLYLRELPREIVKEIIDGISTSTTKMVDKILPEEIDRIIMNGMVELERRSAIVFGKKRRFGDPENPLFVSVRSGAEESSPGEYFTGLKIGFDRSTLAGYGREIDDPYQAYWDYVEYIALYAADIRYDKELASKIKAILGRSSFGERQAEGKYHKLSEIASLCELKKMVDEAEAIFFQSTGKQFPDPHKQLIEAIVTVVESSYGVEGAACTIQAYVFGSRKDGMSGSGVLFTRNPLNGEAEPHGTFIFGAEGKTVVGGGYNRRNDVLEHWIRSEGIGGFCQRLPSAYIEIINSGRLLERYFNETQDVEFTVVCGRLFILQTRGNEKFSTPLAQVKMLLDRIREGVITETEAFRRLRSGYSESQAHTHEYATQAVDHLKWLKAYLESPIVKQNPSKIPVAQGIVVAPGIVTAPIYTNCTNYSGPKGIAVTSSVVEKDDDWERSFTKNAIQERAVGAISYHGNFSDHIAIRIRGARRPIPYIIGVSLETVPKNRAVYIPGIVAKNPTVLHDGDIITIDGNTGRIFEGELPPEDMEDSEIAKVKKGIIPKEESVLYPYYEMLHKWIAILEIDTLLRSAGKLEIDDSNEGKFVDGVDGRPQWIPEMRAVELPESALLCMFKGTGIIEKMAEVIQNGGAECDSMLWKVKMVVRKTLLDTATDGELLICLPIELKRAVFGIDERGIIPTLEARGLAFVGGTAVSLALGAPLAGALLAGIAAEVAAPRISQWLWNENRDSDPFSTPGLPAMASSFTSNAGAGRGGRVFHPRRQRSNGSDLEPILAAVKRIYVQNNDPARINIENLMHAICNLSPRARLVLKLNYGLGTSIPDDENWPDKKYTYEKMAPVFGLSATELKSMGHSTLVELRKMMWQTVSSDPQKWRDGFNDADVRLFEAVYQHCASRLYGKLAEVFPANNETSAKRPEELLSMVDDVIAECPGGNSASVVTAPDDVYNKILTDKEFIRKYVFTSEDMAELPIQRTFIHPVDIKREDGPAMPRVNERMPTLKTILKDGRKLRRFLYVLSVLRKAYPNDGNVGTTLPPMEYARTNGPCFKLGELNIVPLNSYSNRFIIFTEDNGGVYAAELALNADPVSGEAMASSGADIIARMRDRMRGISLIRPLFSARAKGEFRFADTLNRFEDRPLIIDCFEYHDGKYLTDVDDKYVALCAEKRGISPEELAREMKIACIATAFRIHSAGYTCIRSGESCFGKENIRLTRDGFVEYVGGLASLRRHEVWARNDADRLVLRQKETGALGISRTEIYPLIPVKYILKYVYGVRNRKKEAGYLLSELGIDDSDERDRIMAANRTIICPDGHGRSGPAGYLGMSIGIPYPWSLVRPDGGIYGGRITGWLLSPFRFIARFLRLVWEENRVDGAFAPWARGISSQRIDDGRAEYQARRAPDAGAASRDVKGVSWCGIPRNEVRTLLYPGCGLDGGTIASFLENFPNIKEVHLVDSNVQHSSDKIRSAVAKALGPFCDAIRYGTASVADGSSRRVRMLECRRKDGREFVVYLHHYDYRTKDIRPFGLDRGADLVLVKYPGYGAQLTYGPDGDRFYRAAARDMGKYMYITNAEIPVDQHFLDSCVVVDYRCPPALRGSQETVFWNRGVFLSSAGGEYVVLRKNAAGYPLRRSPSGSPAECLGTIFLDGALRTKTDISIRHDLWPKRFKDTKAQTLFDGVRTIQREVALLKALGILVDGTKKNTYQLCEALRGLSPPEPGKLHPIIQQICDLTVDVDGLPKDVQWLRRGTIPRERRDEIIALLKEQAEVLYYAPRRVLDTAAPMLLRGMREDDIINIIGKVCERLEERRCDHLDKGCFDPLRIDAGESGCEPYARNGIWRADSSWMSGAAGKKVYELLAINTHEGIAEDIRVLNRTGWKAGIARSRFVFSAEGEERLANMPPTYANLKAMIQFVVSGKYREKTRVGRIGDNARDYGDWLYECRKALPTFNRHVVGYSYLKKLYKSGKAPDVLVAEKTAEFDAILKEQEGLFRAYIAGRRESLWRELADLPGYTREETAAVAGAVLDGMAESFDRYVRRIRLLERRLARYVTPAEVKEEYYSTVREIACLLERMHRLSFSYAPLYDMGVVAFSRKGAIVREKLFELSTFDHLEFYMFGGLSADGGAYLADILGGKGAGLAAMTRLGLPVPPGFTIADRLTKAIQADRIRRDIVRRDLKAGVREIEKRSRVMHGEARIFADPSSPLFLSVRCGAGRSAPGRYLTVLPVGLSRATLPGYARRMRSIAKAHEDYLEYIMSYPLEDGVKQDELQGEIGRMLQGEPAFRQAAQENSRLWKTASPDDMDRICRAAERIFKDVTGREFPEPWEQLEDAVRAAIGSYYRKDQSVPIGAAVNVQEYVMGDAEDGRSYSGVVFSRNLTDGTAAGITGMVRGPAKGREIVTPGKAALYGESLSGYDLFIDMPADSLDTFRAREPALYAELVEALRLLEKSGANVQDVEIVIESGRLYLLQTRPALRSAPPLARLLLIYRMIQDGIILPARAWEYFKTGLPDAEEMLARVKKALEAPRLKKATASKAFARGIPLIMGCADGTVGFGDDRYLSGGHVFIDDTKYGSQSPQIGRTAAVLSRKQSFVSHSVQNQTQLGVANPHVTGLDIQRISPDEISVNGSTLKIGQRIVVDGFTGCLYHAEDLVESDYAPSVATAAASGAADAGDRIILDAYRFIGTIRSQMCIASGQDAGSEDVSSTGMATPVELPILDIPVMQSPPGSPAECLGTIFLDGALRTKTDISIRHDLWPKRFKDDDGATPFHVRTIQREVALLKALGILVDGTKKNTYQLCEALRGLSPPEPGKLHPIIQQICDLTVDVDGLPKDVQWLRRGTIPRKRRARIICSLKNQIVAILTTVTYGAEPDWSGYSVEFLRFWSNPKAMRGEWGRRYYLSDPIFSDDPHANAFFYEIHGYVGDFVQQQMQHFLITLTQDCADGNISGRDTDWIQSDMMALLSGIRFENDTYFIEKYRAAARGDKSALYTLISYVLAYRPVHLAYIDAFRAEVKRMAPDRRVLSDVLLYYRALVAEFFTDLRREAGKAGIDTTAGFVMDADVLIGATAILQHGGPFDLLDDGSYAIDALNYVDSPTLWPKKIAPPLFFHGVAMPFAAMLVKKMGGLIRVENPIVDGRPRGEISIELPAEVTAGRIYWGRITGWLLSPFRFIARFLRLVWEENRVDGAFAPWARDVSPRYGADKGAGPGGERRHRTHVEFLTLDRQQRWCRKELPAVPPELRLFQWMLVSAPSFLIDRIEDVLANLEHRYGVIADFDLLRRILCTQRQVIEYRLRLNPELRDKVRQFLSVKSRILRAIKYLKEQAGKNDAIEFTDANIARHAGVYVKTVRKYRLKDADIRREIPHIPSAREMIVDAVRRMRAAGITVATEEDIGIWAGVAQTTVSKCAHESPEVMAAVNSLHPHHNAYARVIRILHNAAVSMSVRDIYDHTDLPPSMIYHMLKMLTRLHIVKSVSRKPSTYRLADWMKGIDDFDGFIQNFPGLSNLRITVKDAHRYIQKARAAVRGRSAELRESNKPQTLSSALRNDASPSSYIWRNPDAKREFSPEFSSAIEQCGTSLHSDKIVVETPLVPMARLSERTGKIVLLKDESKQIGGSFKIRGVAANIDEAVAKWLETVTKHPERRGESFYIVTQTDGNHGAATVLGTRLVIEKYKKLHPDMRDVLDRIEPVVFGISTMPQPKKDKTVVALKEYRSMIGSDKKGRVRLTYVNYYRARKAREAFMKRHHGNAAYMEHGGMTIMAGHGSAGLEIDEQLKALGIGTDKKVVVIVPVGAGGPIGIGAALKLRRENVLVIFVQTKRYATLVRSLKAGKVLANSDAPLPTAIIPTRDGGMKPIVFEDGIAVDVLEEPALRVAQRVFDAGVAVDGKASLEECAPLMWQDLVDALGREGAVIGGTTSATGEALLEYYQSLPEIRDADVVVLFGTEGTIDEDVKAYIEGLAEREAKNKESIPRQSSELTLNSVKESTELKRNNVVYRIPADPSGKVQEVRDPSMLDNLAGIDEGVPVSDMAPEPDFRAATHAENRALPLFSISTLLDDGLRLVRAKEGDRPVIFALGTDFIKGYTPGNPQHDALNPHISALRRICEEYHIELVAAPDAKIIGEVYGLIDERKLVNPKVITLTDLNLTKQLSESADEEFAKLRAEFRDACFVGVDNTELDPEGIVPLPAMLALTLKIASGKPVNESLYGIGLDRTSHSFPVLLPRSTRLKPFTVDVLKAGYAAYESA